MQMNILRNIKHSVAQIAYEIIKIFVPIRKGRVLCEAYGGFQYSCNPKYITEKILSDCPNKFEIIWSFQHPDKITGLDDRIIKIKKWSAKEFFYLATSEFLISNIRLNDYGWGWRKRKGQKYVMTWHGSMALKRVEFDAEEHLPESYMRKAELDSKNIDLMLSDSSWCTNFIRNAFHYDGEILECGMPRNDLFFQLDKIKDCRRKVLRHYSISESKKILLYAPTFRFDKSLGNYIGEWDDILTALNKRFDADFTILVRLHPNMMNVVDPSVLMSQFDMIDATNYDDMQELLCAADVLITDYSSSMFEFAYLERPCFLYVPDAETYDRGFYFRIEELPFAQSKSIATLVEKIKYFDEELYREEVRKMYKEKFQSMQKSTACMTCLEWIRNSAL